MVRIETRSRACERCKARKKGCDLQVPACGPCIKMRLSCPGPIPQQERFFSVVRFTPREKQLSASGFSKSRPDLVRCADGRPPAQVATKRRLPRCLTHGVECYAISHEYGRLSILSSDDINLVRVYRTQALLADMYSRSTSRGPLRPAIEAFAILGLAESRDSPELSYVALARHQIALRRVYQLSKDKRGARSNELILSVSMLSKFEARSGYPGFKSRYQTHLDGIVAILEQWPREDFNAESLEVLGEIRDFLMFSE